MVNLKSIQDFISNKDIAVIGASTNKKKFGYIVFDHLRKLNYNVYPVNPDREEIDGVKCYKDISSLPSNVKTAVFITKPEVTEKIVNGLNENSNIKNVWFQQGAESKKAIDLIQKKGLKLIHGECIMMFT